MRAATGTRPLVAFLVRRDRLRLGLWIAGIVVLALSSGASVAGLYPDQESVESYVRLFGDNPALIAFAGPGYGFDDPNRGVVLVNETQLFACVATALMSIFLVNRQTRVEEESERAELVRAGVVGRHAPTVASLVVVTGAQLAVGVASAAGFVALGYDATGSVALAGSLVACGVVFAGIAVVAAQVASTSRATLGIAATALAVAFVVRAAGDIAGNGLSWASPIGWAMAVRAYAGERWWTLLLCVAVAAALVAAAFALTARRDLGSGLLAARSGPPTAPAGLSHPFRLALRLQRGPLVGWSVGLFVTGVVYGSLGEDVDEMIEENPDFADVFLQIEGASVTDSFFGTAMVMLAVLAGGFAISSALVARREEAAGRAEPVLAAPVARVRWAAWYAALTALGTLVTVAAAGLGVGVAYAVVSGDAAQVPRLVGAALVTVPGVLVLAGVAVALFGLAPRAAMAAWAALAVVAVVAFFGGVLQLPSWAREVSPLEHVPRVPAEAAAAPPLVALTVLAGALAAGGLWGFARRDLRGQ